MSPWLNLIVNVGIFDIMLNDNRFKLPHCMLYMLMPITHWLFEIQWKTQINKIFVQEILFMVRHTVINIHIYCDAKLIFFLRIYSWTNAKYLWSLVKTIGWMSDKKKTSNEGSIKVVKNVKTFWFWRQIVWPPTLGIVIEFELCRYFYTNLHSVISHVRKHRFFSQHIDSLVSKTLHSCCSNPLHRTNIQPLPFLVTEAKSIAKHRNTW